MHVKVHVNFSELYWNLKILFILHEKYFSTYLPAANGVCENFFSFRQTLNRPIQIFQISEKSYIQLMKNFEQNNNERNIKLTYLFDVRSFSLMPSTAFPPG